MQQIIIFIGPDRSGKTTIANALSKELNIPYFKKKNEKSLFYSRDLSTLFSEAFYILDFLKETKYSIIRDREYPCEKIYSTVYNRETNEDLIWALDKEYAKLNTKIIYCYKSHYDNFDDDLVKIEEIENIKQEYEKFLILTKNKYIKLCTDSQHLSSQIETIIKFIGES